MNGIMLDCSRNAVMKPEGIERFIIVMAMMGLNMLMLYMEDTYEIEEQPYFGYMRGRFSKEELKCLDDYADKFGIELIPSIQTLAHLTTFLRWDSNAEIMDTPDILLAGSPNTYRLIEQMISAVMEPFRTSRLHLGMDEAHFLGRGVYLKKNGYRTSFDIMNDHLKQVLKVTRKKGIDPMIWSDMYFRMSSETGDYYDKKAIIPDSVIEGMPSDVQFVYWDYYHEDEHFYKDYLKKHKSFGTKPVFAGGIWTFNGIAINYKKTIRSLHAGLSACKQEGISEVFGTLWGDDGAETNPFTGLLGLQLMAEHGYAEKIDMENVKDRFQFCTGADMDCFIALGELDQPPGSAKEVQLEPDNPSKFLLWQDPLLGLFDKQVEGMPLNRFYRELELKLRQEQIRAGGWSWLFELPRQICSVLTMKSEIGIRLKRLYDEDEKEKLRDIADNELVELTKRVEILQKIHYEHWMEINKPFGWEVLDIRYGGLLARIGTTRKRLEAYLSGSISSIPELEEERLPYTSAVQNHAYSRSNVYQKIATPNVF
ncbi:beta-N-acetylhexosaminidase [Pseudalkalibacillus caeni]|uniref:Beta-N-acetylhexosaminidase n=1 Tax=Exobacillus caeni TaxID=2574798 RepID=A0A5R9F9I4_9BACL|nr:beta-N-acetylhexosaminidase [Pseudalkalibacillus caeni]TLS37214.1 beta-N-acetylhexosaminidase [Pseudalkalibacillus caeni]